MSHNRDQLALTQCHRGGDVCIGPGKVGEAVRLCTGARYATLHVNRCFESPNS